MEFHKIVVAYDGSEDATKAAKAASFLAGKFGAEVVVVHVYSPPMMAYAWAMGTPMVDNGLEDAAKSAAEGILERGVSAAKEQVGKVRGELLEAPSTVQALVEFSTTEKADLIVIGTRGMTGFKKLVMGSVSSGVASHAPCPVLVVR